jgi:hypothetical protein
VSRSTRAIARVLEPALVAGFCPSYLLALVLDLIGLRSLRWSENLEPKCV